MLIRISLIVAIVAGLAAAGLNFLQVKDKITTTIKQRDDYHATADAETLAHHKFEKLAKDTQSKLDVTTQELNTTKEQLTEATTKAEEATKKLATTEETLKKTEADRDSARNDLAAWRALGVPLESMRATLNSIKQISEKNEAIELEKKVLERKVARLDNRIRLLTQEDYEVPLPPGLKGKVLVADPKYDFVVLDIGDNQEVKEGGKLLVNRNGKLVAKVVIKSVEPTRSIANVMPGWKLTDIMEGDQVLY
jgi:chromosome segregation ATPase